MAIVIQIIPQNRNVTGIIRTQRDIVTSNVDRNNIEINGNITPTNQTKTPSYTVVPIAPKGDSAYQIAVNNGFVGTEEEWLASLGECGELWLDLATEYTIDPVKIDETMQFEVYQYQYTSRILYRKISLIDSEDSFYEMYLNGIFTNLIASK